jgi:hypothetical protein
LAVLCFFFSGGAGIRLRIIVGGVQTGLGILSGCFFKLQPGWHDAFPTKIRLGSFFRDDFLGSLLGMGFKIAFSAIICTLISAYFLSKSTKISNTEICYIDHQNDDELTKYNSILGNDDEKNKKNMSLPI